MNYDLAKELKDAGYKMALANENDIMSSRSDVWRDPVSSGHWYLFPTLEELIEACGDDLKGLIRYDVGGWGTFEFTTPDGDSPHYIGTTPTEAVARLWLALNKKV